MNYNSKERVRFPLRVQSESLVNQGFPRLNDVAFDSGLHIATHINGMFVSDYKPRFVVPAPNSKDQRVYIKYKIWDIDKGKFVWMKDYDVNRVPEAKRKSFIKERVHNLQMQLNQGYVRSKSHAQAQEQVERIKEKKEALTITQAIDFGITEKKKLNLRQIYNYVHRSEIFKRWLKQASYDRLPANMFKVEQIKAFIHYLRSTRNCSARTINNYMNDLSTLLNVSVENEILEQNYFPKIKKERTGIGKNWGYTLEQQTEILNYAKEHHPHIHFLIHFMYYTLARPNELSHLKIGDIGKRYPNQIWFSETVTKEFMDRNVFIPDALKKIIEESELMKLPKDWYVFGLNFKPGPTRYPAKNWGERYRTLILKKLGGYGQEYTLYSWKHTGIISLIMAGVTPAAVQRQAGHRSPYSFQKYLKTLGLFPNDEILNTFPNLPGS